MEWWFRALNPHRGGGKIEEWCHYRRGSGGGVARDAEATLDVMAAGQTGGGGAAKAGWAG
jgi:hypothetical protein